MDPIPPSGPPGSEEPPFVLQPEPPFVLRVESPRAGPVRPGPNILIAILWWLLLLAVQLIIVGVGVGTVLAIIGQIALGQEGMQRLMKEHGPDFVFYIPGAALVLFFAATGTTVLVAATVAAVLFRRQAPRAMAMRRLSVRHTVLIVLMVLPSGLVAGQMAALSLRLLPRWRLNDKLFEKLSQESWIAILVAGCLLPALGEELFFRGFLSRGLVARHGVVAGTLFTALLFGAMHLDPPLIVGTAVLAIAFQVVFLSTKSLLGPMFFHGLNNVLAFGMMRLARNPHFQQVFGLDDETLLPPLLFAAALAATLAIAWLLYASRTRWLLPDGQVWSPGYVTAEMPPAQLNASPQLSSPHATSVLVAAVVYLLFAAALAWELRHAW